MSAHPLDRRPQERLTAEIQQLRNELSELRTLQRIGNENLSAQISATAESSVSLNNNFIAVFTMTLTSNLGLRLFGFPNVTLFEGSVAAGNEIGYGLLRDASYRVIRSEFDWGATDNNTLVFKISIVNLTGSTQTIHFRGNFRYLVSAGDVSQA